MDTQTLAEQRRAIYEIAEAIAPTWERRRAEVEEVATPVREWMLRELRPQAGDTVSGSSTPNGSSSTTSPSTACSAGSGTCCWPIPLRASRRPAACCARAGA